VNQRGVENRTSAHPKKLNLFNSIDYYFLSFFIGYLFNRRQISLREFLLGGRSAGPLSIGFSAAASWLTAGALLADRSE
jgi:SSS family solute:Na+ symporter